MVVVMSPDAGQADVDSVVELVRTAGGEAFGAAAYPARSSGWWATWSSSAR